MTVTKPPTERLGTLIRVAWVKVHRKRNEVDWDSFTERRPRAYHHLELAEGWCWQCIRLTRRR